MASSKQYKTEEAEAAAKLAARDLEEVQREREESGRVVTGSGIEKDESGRGVIGSVLKAVESTVETIKETVAGRSPTAPEIETTFTYQLTN